MDTPVTLSLEQKVGTLAGAIVQVIQGLRNGSVTSKPITIMDENAEEWPTMSLEAYLWDELAKCGIKESRAAIDSAQRQEGR